MYYVLDLAGDIVFARGFNVRVAAMQFPTAIRLPTPLAAANLPHQKQQKPPSGDIPRMLQTPVMNILDTRSRQLPLQHRICRFRYLVTPITRVVIDGRCTGRLGEQMKEVTGVVPRVVVPRMAVRSFHYYAEFGIEAPR